MWGAFLLSQRAAFHVTWGNAVVVVRPIAVFALLGPHNRKSQPHHCEKMNITLFERRRLSCIVLINDEFPHKLIKSRVFCHSITVGFGLHSALQSWFHVPARSLFGWGGVYPDGVLLWGIGRASLFMPFCRTAFFRMRRPDVARDLSASSCPLFCPRLVQSGFLPNESPRRTSLGA